MIASLRSFVPLFSIALLLTVGPGRADVTAENKELPHFQELLRLIRVHLDNVTEEELNTTLSQALLNQFHPRIQLVSELPPEDADGETSGITASAVYGEGFVYLRLTKVRAGVADEIVKAVEEYRADLKSIAGLIVDLRFAEGDDFKAAAQVGDLWVSEGRSLVRWGDEDVGSTVGAPFARIPTTVLINGQTRGAAEVLTVVLRDEGPAVVLGGATAGDAYAFETFELSNGQRLRVASLAVVVGESSTVEGGVEPDLVVDVDLETEEAYLADPYLVVVVERPPGQSSLGMGAAVQSLRQVDEAELLRRQNERMGRPNPSLAVPEPARVRSVQDPVLKQAIDLLIGIRVLNGPPQ